MNEAIIEAEKHLEAIGFIIHRSSEYLGVNPDGIRRQLISSGKNAVEIERWLIQTGWAHLK